MDRRSLGFKLRRFGLVAFAACVTAPLIYVFYHQLSQSALQAEAKLMVSYLHTLEKVYRQERGSYAYFPAYGAPQKGQDFCVQPEGAAALGFFVHGCHQAEAMPPRYTYRIIEPEAPEARVPQAELSYQIEARAGSDALGRSLVCFAPQQEELWVSSPRRKIESVLSCW